MGLNWCLLQWKGGVLTPEPPGKSLNLWVKSDGTWSLGSCMILPPISFVSHHLPISLGQVLGHPLSATPWGLRASGFPIYAPVPRFLPHSTWAHLSDMGWGDRPLERGDWFMSRQDTTFSFCTGSCKLCFWTVLLEKTLESPLDCREIKPVNPKGNQSWIFIARTDGEAETSVSWPPDAKNWLIGKYPDAGKDWKQEEKGMTDDEMVGWHHRLDGHEFEQAPVAGDGQGSLAY